METSSWLINIISFNFHDKFYCVVCDKHKLIDANAIFSPLQVVTLCRFKMKKDREGNQLLIAKVTIKAELILIRIEKIL